MHKKISIFWFRRDLRLQDNVGLTEALNDRYPVLPIFIFDQDIIEELPRDDARVNFIYDQVYQINKKLKENRASLMCLKGNPLNVGKKILET